MKQILFSILSLLVAVQVFAADCPDFSGKYKENLSEIIMTVSQKACSQITVEAGGVSKTYILDGSMRQVSAGRFEKNYFDNQTLVREIWSAEINGEMLGPKVTWNIYEDAQAFRIWQREIDEDSRVMGNVMYTKIQ